MENNQTPTSTLSPTSPKVSFFSKYKFFIFAFITLCFILYYAYTIYKKMNENSDTDKNSSPCEDPSLIRNSAGICVANIGCDIDEILNTIGVCECKSGTSKWGGACCATDMQKKTADGTKYCCNELCGSTCCQPGQKCKDGKCSNICGSKTSNNTVTINTCGQDEKCVIVHGITDTNLATLTTSLGADPKIIAEKVDDKNLVYYCERTTKNEKCAVGNEKSFPPAIDNFSPCFYLRTKAINSLNAANAFGYCAPKSIDSAIDSVITSCKSYKDSSACEVNSSCEWVNLLAEITSSKTITEVMQNYNRVNKQKQGYFCKTDETNSYFRILSREQGGEECTVQDCISEFSKSVGIVDIRYDYDTKKCAALQTCNADDPKYKKFDITRFNVDSNGTASLDPEKITSSYKENLKGCAVASLPKFCTEKNCDTTSGLISEKIQYNWRVTNLIGSSLNRFCTKVEKTDDVDGVTTFETEVSCVQSIRNGACAKGYTLRATTDDPKTKEDYACFIDDPKDLEQKVDGRIGDQAWVYSKNRTGVKEYSKLYACGTYNCSAYIPETDAPPATSTFKHYVMVNEADYKWIEFRDPKFMEPNFDCKGRNWTCKCSPKDEDKDKQCILIWADDKECSSYYGNLICDGSARFVLSETLSKMFPVASEKYFKKHIKQTAS